MRSLRFHYKMSLYIVKHIAQLSNKAHIAHAVGLLWECLVPGLITTTLSELRLQDVPVPQRPLQGRLHLRLLELP